jgi:hypothetical protein
MRFRLTLTYTGPIKATQRDSTTQIPKRPIHDTKAYWGGSPIEQLPLYEYIARRYSEFGYRFTSLV